MMKIFFLLTACSFGLFWSSVRGGDFERDIFSTSQGELTITFIGHGTLMLEFAGKVVHVDPVAEYADYRNLPKADLVLITHEHSDHLNTEALDLVCKADTDIIINEKGFEKTGKGTILKNGQSTVKKGLPIEAVPAYNIMHMRSPGNPYHPKGQGNGYVLTLGDKSIYIAGDTENVPEMKELKAIDIAFLPMNLPYTMTPEMVAEAAKSFKPKVLYPYHFGRTDTAALIELLRNSKETEVRIRKMM